MRYLLTGASGFIGHNFKEHLRSTGHTVFTLSARSFHSTQQLDWLELCNRIQPSAIVHLAGLAHRRPSKTQEAAHQLWMSNVHYPVQLAAVAANAGVPRFVFVSSIGVHGVQTFSGQSFHEDSPFSPENPYAASKCEAEFLLHQCLSPTPTQLVIVRPALVCGRGAPGNIHRLARLVRSGVPLPFANVLNQRSFVVIENLCDLLERVAIDPAAAGHVFLAAEPHTVSTAEVISCMARHWQRGPRLWPCPQAPMVTVLNSLGFRSQARQLLGSLVVDASKAREVLCWRPLKSLQQSLCESADL